MVKNIILDIGEVLAHFHWETILTDTLHLTGEAYEAVANATGRSNMWGKFDLNNVPDEVLIDEAVSRAPEYEKEVREFFLHTGELITEFPYTKEWVDTLHKMGFRVYILSNFGKTSFLECRQNGRLPVVDMADGYMISFEYGLVKPHADSYTALLNKYSLKASECVFFDDRQENVDGAIAVGMRGFLFTDYKEAMDRIKELNS